MSYKFEPAVEPYEVGDIVHIYDPRFEWEHRFGHEVVEVHDENSKHTEVGNHLYTLRGCNNNSVLDKKYPHNLLIPSPRGYPNIDKLLGETKINGEKLLGKYKRSELQLVNEFLTAVDVDSEPTSDWLNEIRQNEVDRINSALVELCLLYYLRQVFGKDRISMNANLCKNDDSKNFDFRLNTCKHDIWIEVTKPDHSSKLEGQVEFGLGKRTTNNVDRKLETKFEPARDAVPNDAVLIIAVYQEDPITQSFEISRWLDKGYYDVSQFSDGLLMFSDFHEPSFEFYVFSQKGADCTEALGRLVDDVSYVYD